MNLQKIRKRIKKTKTLKEFAQDIGLREATLYDFLNGKLNINMSTLEKIIEPLGMDVLDKLPDTLVEVQAVSDDGQKIKKGNKYKGKKVALCFGTVGTTHQALILEGEGGMELALL